jgi:hypothetical protein
MAEQKFLSTAGVSRLWTNVVTKISSDVLVEQQRAQIEEDRIANLLKTEEETARKAEQKNEENIKTLSEVVIKIAENNVDISNSLNRLATWVENHDKEVIPVIQKNQEDIATIMSKLDIGDMTVSEYVADIAINVPIATTERAGSVKPSKEITVAENGEMGIGYISTDKLVQGIKTLVLDGGDAEIS